MTNQNNISLLLFKYLHGTITPEEEKKLIQWKLESPENQKFFDALMPATAEQETHSNKKVHGNLEQRILAKITDAVPELQTKRIGGKKTTWKYVAAAAAVVVIAVNIAVFSSRDEQKTKPVAKTAAVKQQEDVDAPEGVYATITLADGKQLSLSSTATGKLASQGVADLVKTADGFIVYKASSQKNVGTAQHNTLTNPKGSNVIGIMLEDGTRIWLNAESSLTYPVAFTGKERNVSIEGEAYFEVAKNKRKPFKVLHNGTEIRVLGTHFNVNAYANSSHTQVTLFEGSVKVTNGSYSGVLKPGQQASVIDKKIKVKSVANVDRAVAWKNGFFSFDKADITEVMNQIARWYNVTVKYEGEIPAEKFGGDLRRNSKLSSVLKILGTSGVKFRVEGNTVTVFK
jgi:ferric-dicitrate binding protein FerR (iron transport regulator)